MSFAWHKAVPSQAGIMLSVGETETERGAGRWEGERERQKPEVSTLTRSRGYKLDQSSSFTNTYGQPPRQTDHRYQLHCWTANNSLLPFTLKLPAVFLHQASIRLAIGHTNDTS